MDKAYSNSARGFNISIITYGLVIGFSILAKFVNPLESGFNEMLHSLVILSVIICLVIGIVYSFRGRKEPNSWKKIIGITLNSILLIIFISALVMFFFDIYQILNVGNKI